MKIILKKGFGFGFPFHLWIKFPCEKISSEEFHANHNWTKNREKKIVLCNFFLYFCLALEMFSLLRFGITKKNMEKCFVTFIHDISHISYRAQMLNTAFVWREGVLKCFRETCHMNRNTFLCLNYSNPAEIDIVETVAASYIQTLTQLFETFRLGCSVFRCVA